MTGYFLLKDLKKNAPKIFGIPTRTKLDEMFYMIVKEDGKWVKKRLGGIPHLSIINITGIPDTGKSILAEQFAVVQAGSGYRVLFVTVESPANFLYTSLKQKVEVLGLDFGDVEENIVVIDASQNPELRENMKSLLDTMKYAIKERKTTNVIIDSVTGLYEHKEMMARQIVRVIFNFLKKWKQTGVLVSQKRSSQGSETAEAAGGLAVAHIVDGTVIMDKRIVETKWESNLYGLDLGEVIRLIRIDGCRLAPHDSRSWVFEITDHGLINIISPLNEFVKRGEKYGGNR
ncbi:MAG: KaiC domain-containing protein [Candidatus Aenigmatarchaeota archaeon]|nr:MAG: KaiC domain-containing protein [Candidatus Aenigmarchaeota archaeon]